MKAPFKKISLSGGWKVEYDRTLCDSGLLEELETHLSGKGAASGWSPLESSRNTKLWIFGKDGRRYVFKLFLPRGPLEPLKARMRGTRAERAWAAGHELLERGFLTPPVLAWGVKRAGGLPGRNFLVTGFIPDATGLYTLLSGELAALPHADGSRIRRTLMSALGERVGRLHSSGIVHGDLRLDNILVRGWKTGRPEFYFIDNERNTLFENVAIPRELIVKNLVQLNMIKLEFLTRTDRARFLRAYISCSPDMPGGKKELACEVWEATALRMGKKHGGFLN